MMHSVAPTLLVTGGQGWPPRGEGHGDDAAGGPGLRVEQRAEHHRAANARRDARARDLRRRPPIDRGRRPLHAPHAGRRAVVRLPRVRPVRGEWLTMELHTVAAGVVLVGWAVG